MLLHHVLDQAELLISISAYFREARHPTVAGGNRSGGGGDALGSRHA